MHYGDKKQIKTAIFEFVIYKHDILRVKNRKIKRNKNGLISRRDVSYQITSIKKCKNFNPRLVKLILNDPYKYLAKHLDGIPHEEFYLVTLNDIDGYNKFNVYNYTRVSEWEDKTMTLH